MARNICEKCQRPLKTCLCHLIHPAVNSTRLVILQHPSEVSQAKGSATLLNLSLANSEIIVGENFNDNEDLLQILDKYSGKIALLYPGEQAEDIEDTAIAIECLIVLDATWKKSFKMFQLSTILHSLPQFTLATDYQSLYQVRKTKKEHALSTLEASCHALTSLESNETRYQPLLASFVEFNRQLMSFRSQ